MLAYLTCRPGEQDATLAALEALATGLGGRLSRQTCAAALTVAVIRLDRAQAPRLHGALLLAGAELQPLEHCPEFDGDLVLVRSR